MRTYTRGRPRQVEAEKAILANEMELAGLVGLLQIQADKQSVIIASHNIQADRMKDRVSYLSFYIFLLIHANQ